MRSKILLLLLFFYLGTSVSAHEFWLEPETFHPKAKTTVPINIKVGMNFEGGLWKGDLKNITRMPVVSGTSKDSLLPKLGLQQAIVRWQPPAPGQYLLGLINKSSFIELEAEKFESYVVSEGLERIVEERERLGESEKAGRELYKRCAKVLVQQGDNPHDSTFAESFGFPVEFLALNDPYDNDNQQLSFKLVSQGKPLAGAKVMIWHKNEEDLKRSELRTDEQGTVTFALRPEGVWLVSAVHMERATESDRADWQSYWASYGFGYR